MSFDQKKTVRPLLLGLLAVVFLLPACGKKGPPLPPLRDVPLRTTDLNVRQQGPVLLFDLGYPSSTTAGMPLGGIDALEVLQLVKPALEGQALPIEAPEMEGQGEVLMTLRGAELGSAISGDRIQLRIPLAAELPEEPSAHYFGVRSIKGNETSSLSNLVALVPMAPPPAPQNLRATAAADAIELYWDSPADTVVGYEIYRRDAQQRGYAGPIKRLETNQTTYRDNEVIYGKRYIYTVRALASLDPPIVSAEAGEREIDYEDRFPPDLPRNFVALGERSRVRLRWDASQAPDIGGYIIYRKEPGREFHRITEDPLTTTELIDRGLVTGFTYEYQIQVVDKSGNESPISEPVKVEAR